MSTATTVSSGDRYAITASASTNCRTAPADSGTMASSPCTSWRSVIDLDTTWPVRISSCLRPSSRCSDASRSRRRSCWTSIESRPASMRRPNWHAKRTRPNSAMAAATVAIFSPLPAVASSMATLVSNGNEMSMTAAIIVTPRAPSAVRRCSMHCAIRRLIHPRRVIDAGSALSSVDEPRRGAVARSFTALLCAIDSPR